MSLVRFSTSLVALFVVAGVASAQTPTLDSGAGPHVELTVAQKQTIYQSISKTQKNNAAPTGFRAAVGAPLPEGIVVGAMPATIMELIPQTKGLEAALVEGQVLLVEPERKNVVAVIAQER